MLTLRAAEIADGVTTLNFGISFSSFLSAFLSKKTAKLAFSLTLPFDHFYIRLKLHTLIISDLLSFS
jgi:hypothetical protein